jgi:hypothetical protein
MRPLVYLSVRTFYNGIRRAITSPKRAASLIFFGIYYYFLIVRSVAPTHQGSVTRLPYRLAMPESSVLGGILFAGFALASIFMAGGSGRVLGGFKPADIEVLFPTPVDPRIVLMFRLVRDYFFTLLAPLVLATLGWRGTSIGMRALFRNYPVHSMDVLRATWIAWMLMSLAFVSIGYGVSLFVGRSDLKSDRNQKILSFGINGVVLVTLGLIGYRLHGDLSWKTALGLTQSNTLQLIFLPATLASDLVTGSLSGNFFLIGLAAMGLLATAGLGISLALTQVGWLYDQGAAKGFRTSSAVKMRRAGDQYGMAAERARSGKKPRHILAGKLSKRTYHNSLALVWKELLLQLRGPMSGVLIKFLGVLAAYGVIGWVVSGNGTSTGLSRVEIILPCFAAYFLGVSIGFGGFREMLKKVDLLKPLPFTSNRIVLYEVVAKAPIPIFMLAGGAIELTVYRPSEALNNLAGFLVASALLLEITGSILAGAVLFPDYEDPTQRGISGLVMLLSVVICSSPGIGLFLLLSQILNWSLVAAALPSGALLILITIGLSYLSGNLYSGYNQNE